MGVVVIACYRPKPGKASDLEILTREHAPILRAQGLVTERAPIVSRAEDGTIIEVFEWISQEAIDGAHANPKVVELWQRYGALCDYVKLAEVKESAQMFACFTPVN